MESIRQLCKKTVEFLVTDFRIKYPEGLRFLNISYLPNSNNYYSMISELLENGTLCKRNGEKYPKPSIRDHKRYSDFRLHHELGNTFIIVGQHVSFEYDDERYKTAFASGSNHPDNNVKMGIKICLLYLYFCVNQGLATSQHQVNQHQANQHQTNQHQANQHQVNQNTELRTIDTRKHIIKLIPKLQSAMKDLLEISKMLPEIRLFLVNLIVLYKIFPCLHKPVNDLFEMYNILHKK